ncbi:MAG: hypothetical protein WDO71_21675 [Bacteroidota bacterium]
MQAGFHNHDTEFVLLDGELIYDALLGRFGTDLVKLQFQTQVIVHGYKPRTILKNTRAGLSPHIYLTGTADKKEAAIGKGIIDWKEFFAAAKTGGVKNFFVEMAPDKFTDSATYIHQL